MYVFDAVVAVDQTRLVLWLIMEVKLESNDDEINNHNIVLFLSSYKDGLTSKYLTLLYNHCHQ